MSKQYVNNNGVLIPIESYAIKAGNRGHLYGDGFFESIRVINGKMINFGSHFKRLTETFKVLFMNPPHVLTQEYLEKEINFLLVQNGITEGGKIRLSIDRKPGGTYLPRTNDIDYFIEAYPLPQNTFTLNEAGYRVDIYNDIKKNINPLSNYKTKNGLIYIMGKLYAKAHQLDDVLLQNDKLGIIETTSANIFIVSNGVLYTPALDAGCLGGTMRMQIINLALANNMKVYECVITPQNLLAADELFLTNAITGVTWVGNFRTKIYHHTVVEKIHHLLINKWI
ncbi:MAG: aminotransferase class IV [Putridiphycobacter sp.]|nr:aminotransferase class IV [Putridiphycobacter sp.]